LRSANALIRRSSFRVEVASYSTRIATIDRVADGKISPTPVGFLLRFCRKKIFQLFYISERLKSSEKDRRSPTDALGGEAQRLLTSSARKGSAKVRAVLDVLVLIIPTDF
jgi:hypothetical protein